MIEAVLVFKVWFVAGWFALFFVLERIAAAAPPPKSRWRLVVNGALWLLMILVSPLIVLPLTAFASAHPLWTRPEGWSGLPALAVDILIFDLWAYWVHRAYHEIPLMRRLHMPHHLDEHLDTTTAVRFHVGEVALSAALRMAPIVLLAIPFAHVVVFETALLAASIFHHSNVRLPPALESVLSRIVVTPSIHWVHHHAVGRDTNSNYAGVFSLWDPLFGTRSPTRRAPDMKIGVEGLEDRPLWPLLLTPFMKASP
ncbi:MAG: sterol desaturase family protein [Amphiplicatus sp.]